MDSATAFLLATLTGGNAPPSVQTDATNIPASNPTTATAITKAWGMLPGTPVAGQVYTLTTELTGTWEGNALAFNVGITPAGGTAAWTQFNPAIAAGAWTAGTIVGGWLALTVRVLSATQARFAIYGAVSESTVSVTPSTGSAAVAPISQTLAIAAGDSVAIGVLFGASNAAQGIASYGSTFTTIGGGA